jgi:Ricin-type beta-trefoil lectin domain
MGLRAKIVLAAAAVAVLVLPAGEATARPSQPAPVGERPAAGDGVNPPALRPLADTGWEGRRLRSMRHPAFCLDANRNEWHEDQGRIQLWHCNGWSNQQWWADYTPWPGTTQIRTPGHPQGPLLGRCLSAFRDRTVWITRCANTPDEDWFLEYDISRGLRIISRLTGLCLDVADWAGHDGGAVWQFPCHNNGSNQFWDLH